MSGGDEYMFISLPPNIPHGTQKHKHSWMDIQYRLGTTESHSSQQRKIRHIYRGVGKTIGVHSVTLQLSSIDLDRPSPNEFY